MQCFEEYAKFYDLRYKDKKYKEEADFVYSWARQPSSILELGCGTGKHAKYWCKKAEVMALDKSLFMMKKGFKSKNIAYVVADITNYDFDLGRKFDCVVAMFNVVGYADLLYYINKVYDMLEPGGYFIFDCWDRGEVHATPPTERIKKVKDTEFKIKPVFFCYDNDTIKFRLDIKKKRKTITEYHYVRSYSKYSLSRLAEKAGFLCKEKQKEVGSEWVWWYKWQKNTRHEE